MGNWGIAKTATPKEKLKSEMSDYLNGLKDLLDKMYDLAKSENKKGDKNERN